MSRPTRWALLLLTFLLLPRLAGAQQGSGFGLGGGFSVPSGVTSDGLNTGWHVLALVDLAPSSPVGLRLDAALHRLPYEGGEGHNRVLAATADVRVWLGGAGANGVRAYLVTGAGIYNFRATFSIAPPLSDTRAGVNAGAGLTAPVLGVPAFIEARFHDVFVPGDDFRFIPVTAGVRFPL